MLSRKLTGHYDYFARQLPMSGGLATAPARSAVASIMRCSIQRTGVEGHVPVHAPLRSVVGDNAAKHTVRAASDNQNLASPQRVPRVDHDAQVGPARIMACC